AEVAGRVFTGDKLEQRVDAVRAFSQGNKSQPVGIVITEADLTQAVAAGATNTGGVASVSNVKVSIDGAGLHVTGQAVAAPPPVPRPEHKSYAMRQYLDVLRKAMTEGDDRQDRTGAGTRAIFGEVMRFRMSDGFPAMTTKRLAFRSVVAELLWFLNGSSDVRELHALGVHIWDGNAYAPYWRERARFEGDAGRNYGQQWRDWVAPDGRRI